MYLYRTVVQTFMTFPWCRGYVMPRGMFCLDGSMVVMLGFASRWEHDNNEIGIWMMDRARLRS